MILAIDIGNTNIVLGGIDQEKTHFVARLATNPNRTADEYAILIREILTCNDIEKTEVTGSILSCVVPPLVNEIKGAIVRLFEREPLIVEPGIKTGLNILIDNPGQLGSDMVVAATAALNKYELPMIILDMGTATTLSILDKSGSFIGAVILPGVVVSNESLISRTAQLQKISPEAPPNVIGKNTIDSMKSGMIFGNAAMLDGLIERIEAELGARASVIATGGLAGSIVSHCKREVIIDDDLLLDGLWCIYKKNCKD